MSRNGSGVYSLPAGNPVVTGTTISSSWANTTLSDIASALTGSVAADGQTPMTGNLQMGSNKVTGLAAGTLSTDAVNLGQITGGTTAGSFTTLSASSTVTFSGGTANGVLYLNGSKVATSGSALTFDGTNLGVGTSSPNVPLTFASSTGRKVGFYQGTQGYSIGVESSNFKFVTDASAAFTWANGATYSTAAEYMRLDPSGNLGLGVTPSAWYSGWKAFDISSAGAISASGNGTIIWGNGYLNSSVSPIYKTNGYAVRYVAASDVGQHIWQTAPSGTAGNAISFTQAMTLDASGNLLVGTTTTAVTSAGTAISAGNINLRTSNSASYMMGFYTSGGTAAGNIYSSGSTTTYNTSSDYRLKDITGNLTGYKERIMALQPKQGSWKVDGSEFRGFLAHEFASQYPTLVSGEKDAVDEKGNPKYQGMQAGGSETIADLVALAQEQQAIIQSLTARLEALESK